MALLKVAEVGKVLSQTLIMIRERGLSRSSMKNFWNELNKPIFILAPMEDVTDTVLRQVIARCGKPAVFFTEFTNVEGMFSKGAAHVAHRLQYTEIEKPLVAQIWGSHPENFCKAAKYIRDMGMSAVDLNMGCPA